MKPLSKDACALLLVTSVERVALPFQMDCIGRVKTALYMALERWKSRQVAASLEGGKTTMEPELICEVCGRNKAIGAACVPGVPYSALYCRECLQANSHPMDVLIANTACCGGLEHCADWWTEMVMDSLKHQNKSLDWFEAEVSKSG